ncbi:MAG: EVE domain-containing protein [Alphaproteobacteria bacterium]
MAYWLFKSEPETYSWDDMVREGVGGWDGVRNHQAQNNMKAMQVGDRGFFYHSVGEKAIVGIVEVAEPYQPDPTDSTGKWGMVKVRAVRPVGKPVTLAEIKAEPDFADLPLVRQSRLSVSPVPAEAWNRICAMAGVDP